MPPLGTPSELHLTYRFMVAIEGLNVAAFTECTLPSLQVETEEIKEGGLNAYSHKLPVRVNAGTITLRRGITRNDQLLQWYLQVLKGDMKSATRTVTVVTFDLMGTPVSIWTFYGAFPVKWSGPAMKSGESAVAIEEIEFAHHGFEVE
ncbi:MAG TPA: phage tail protein [Phototrophicaceae bacterium]|nr:phage tail protein [Phototrophicaceae bacterium]